jgi:hypothetical protein
VRMVSCGVVCGQLVNWLGGWVVGWLGGWVVGWLGGWVVGWLGGGWRGRRRQRACAVGSVPKVRSQHHISPQRTHALCELEPVLGVYVPVGQSMHVEILVAPTVVEYDEIGHSMYASAPSPGTYEPAGASTQEAVPVEAAYVPTSHSTHVEAAFAPTVEDAKPAAARGLVWFRRGVNCMDYKFVPPFLIVIIDSVVLTGVVVY